MKKRLLFLSLLVINVLMAQVPTYVPTDGLQAWYPFTGNANDESGNNLNGTVNGANLTTDRFNTQNAAYSFAPNQEIYIPNTENLNTYPLTISLWYNASSLEDGMASNIFSKYVPTAWNGFQILLSDCRNVSNNGATLNNGFGVSSWYLRDFNNRVIGYYDEDPFLQQNISSDVWYHYVFTLDSTGGKIYLNGQLIDSHSWTGNSGASNNQFLWKIGGFYNSWYNGKIDDIGIWNRALTQQEITNLYNSSLPQNACLPSYVPTNGLMGYWPFCGNANDESGNGNNGIIHGTTPISDRFGNNDSAYSFNGSNNYISIPYSSSIGVQQNISISFWVYMNGGGCGPRILQSQPWGQCGGYYITTNSNSNVSRSFSGSIDDCTAVVGGISTAEVNSLSWHHVIFTASGLTGTYQFYFDGDLVSSNNTNQFFSSINYNNHTLIIGNIDQNSCNWFGGYLDDIGIWNRILTQQEITGLHTTLGTNEVIQNNKITIYPNPAKEQITIDCGNLSNTIGWSYIIANTLGQEVSNGVMNSQQNVVSLNTLNGTGVYLVKIFDAESNLISTKKIIKE